MQKELFSASGGQTEAETIITLRQTTERLSELLMEHEKLKRDTGNEGAQLKLKLKEAEI